VTSDHEAPTGRSSLRVTSSERPGWRPGDGSIPRVGERVFCVHGQAEVVRVLGRTGDGSRLLELRLALGQSAPYFAAASNVLRRSEDATLGGSPTDLIGGSEG